MRRACSFNNYEVAVVKKRFPRDIADMRRKAQVRITPDQAFQNILDFLEFRFTYHTRDQWRQAIYEGRILHNGECPAPECELQAGDSVEYLMPDVDEPSVNSQYTLLLSDFPVLALGKPPDLPVHPAGRYFHNTLWALLRNSGYGNIRFVNRLDRETSGVVLVALTKSGARECGKQLQAQRILKQYMVLVEGIFPDELTAEGWLEPDVDSAVKKKVRFKASCGSSVSESKKAVTHFRRITAASAAGYSLVEALPETGRYHQIRATLLGLGFPVVGDKLYGKDETAFLRFREGCLTREDEERLRLSRQALHAARISFNHPVHGQRLQVHAPLPPDMRNVLDFSIENEHHW